MKVISLTHGYEAVVDDYDFEFLSQWKWHYKDGYAARTENFRKPDGTRSAKIIRMHRIIANTPQGLDTDHINGNKLDNRRSNLRIATRQQNCANQKAVSGFKGVYKHRNRWKVYIAKKYIGMYSTAEEAARAYNEVATAMYGEFARLNDA